MSNQPSHNLDGSDIDIARRIDEVRRRLEIHRTVRGSTLAAAAAFGRDPANLDQQPAPTPVRRSERQTIETGPSRNANLKGGLWQCFPHRR